MGSRPQTLLRFATWQAAALLVLCAMLALVPERLSAQDAFAPGSVCHISVKSSVSYEDAAKSPQNWICEGAELDWEAERHIIRHDFSSRSDDMPNPRYAEFDRNEFKRLTVVVTGRDGHVVTHELAFSDLKLGASSLKAMAEIPDPHSPIVSVAFVHEGGWFPESFVTARISDQASVPPIAGNLHILAAILCGLLLAPVIFDLVFFKALREPFPLYHAVFCLMAALQTAAVTGILPMLWPMSYNAELDITYVSLDFMIAATFLFAYHFIEEGRLPRRYRRWLLALSAITLVSGLATNYFIDFFGYWVDHVYFGILLTLFAVYYYLLFKARQQGSRMAIYLAFGIAPLVLVVIAQSGSVFFPTIIPEIDETWPQNFALLFEVVATALAVAERFMRLRRERDLALSAARDLELLSELDELTGLRNRRALDAQFPELLREGFHAMAVVDLDHFKSINDIYGHPVGDRVIMSTAWALSPGDDNDLVAYRLGGEEFLLLLRGEDAAEKAEERRQEVTKRVMAAVYEIPHQVTASMGLLDFAPVAEEPGLNFSTLYTQVDRLLYEAKVSGRNCSRIKIFDSLPDRDGELRRAAAAA